MDKSLKQEIFEKKNQGLTDVQIFDGLRESSIEVTLKEVQSVMGKVTIIDNQRAVRRQHPEIEKLNVEALELLDKLAEKVDSIIKVKTRPEVRQSFSPQTIFLRTIKSLRKTFL